MKYLIIAILGATLVGCACMPCTGSVACPCDKVCACKGECICDK